MTSAKIGFGTNISSLQTQRRLAEASRITNDAAERLSSGLRINKASDDAAGLAIATNLNTDARVAARGYLNFSDGISLLTIAEGATDAMREVVTRVSELAQQAANGSLSREQRLALQAESDALVSEYGRIAESTKFNGLSVFSTDGNSIQLQGGYGTDGMIAVDYINSFLKDVGTTITLANTSHTIGTLMVGGDINNDGFGDFVSSTGLVYLGNSAGTLGAGVAAFTGSFQDIQLFDIDGDGNLDAITATSTSINFRRGNGDGTFAAAVTSTVSGALRQIVVGDFDNDGTQDVGYLTTTTMGVAVGNGSGTFTPSGTIAHVGDFYGLSVGDFNGDGNLDLVNDSVTVGFGDGNGGFSSITIVDSPSSGAGGDVATADFDRDGFSDLVVVDGNNTTTLVYFGAADGTFSTRGTSYSISGIQQGGSIAADLNGDGYMDFITTQWGSTATRFLNNGDGTFTQGSFATGTYSNRVAVTDFNGDGSLDILTASGFSSQARLRTFTTTNANGLQYFTLASVTDARKAITAIQTEAQRIDRTRGVIGAALSRLEVGIRTLQSSKDNFLAAAGRIMDSDVAMEAAQFTRGQILQNTAAAVLAQANQQPEIVLNILRNSAGLSAKSQP